MSTTIDEKVVEMRFDNKQFESGVQTSLSSIDKLKKSLKFDGVSKGLEEVGDSAKKCDMSVLGRSIEAVQTKFSALETIAVGALLRIGGQIAATGTQMLNSLTIEPVTKGWEKFEQKTTAVQTIMSATGKTVDEVNGSLEKLIWFTDETSYSMTDMTSNIGKFTSQGIDLDVAVSAMEGISTWAALSGQGVNEASRAMYNLSQAIGVGAVKLQDWRSIENAYMSTKEFKEMAMEAAVATGDLTKSFDKAGNAIYKTSKGTEVTAANFSSTLQDAWFSSDALLNVLNNYGSYADGVYELYNNLGDGVDKTTSEIISDLKSLQGADDETILSAGYTQDQIELVRKLSDEVGGVGQRSFAAAQEAKTFSEVIGSVQEAVSSGWTKTFETIFGNYEEAKVLWTDLANELYDVFAEGGNTRNEVLKDALSISGFDRFTEAISTAGIEMDDFTEKLRAIAEEEGVSFDSIITDAGSLEKAIQNGAISTETLLQAVYACTDGISHVDLHTLKLSLAEIIHDVDALSGREHLISAFWNAWEGARTILATLKDAFYEIFPPTTAEQIYSFVVGLDELTSRFKTFLTESEEGQKLLTDLKNTFKGVFAVLDIVKQAFVAVWNALAPVRTATGGLLSSILGLSGSFGEWLSNLDETIRKNDTFAKGIQKVIDFIKGAKAAVKEFAENVREKLHLPSFEEAKESIKGFLGVLKEKIGAPGLELLRSIFEKLCNTATRVRDAISRMKDGIVESFDRVDNAVTGSKIVQVLTGIWNFVKVVAGAIGNLLGQAFGKLIEMLRNADFNGVLEFLNTLAAGGLVVAIKKFADTGSSLKGAITGFLDWAAKFGEGINTILSGVENCLEAWQTKLKADALLKIAGAIAILTASLLVLSLIDSDKLTSSITALAGLFAELVGSMALLSKIDITGQSASKAATTMIKISAAVLILSGALKNIAVLEPEQLSNGLVGLGTLMGELVVMFKMMQADGKTYTKGASQLLIAAAALTLLSVPLKRIGEMGWDALCVGLTGLVSMVGMMVILFKTMETDGSTFAKGSGQLLVAAAALTLLSVPLKNVSKMGWEGLAKGLTGLAGLVAMMVVLFKTMETNGSSFARGSGNLLVAAGALTLLAIPLRKVGEMSWDGVAKGLVGLGGVVAMMVILFKTMETDGTIVTKGSGNLLIAAGALTLLSVPLKKVGEMSWDGVEKGLIGLGGVVAMMVILFKTMETDGTIVTKGSGNLLVAAGALTLLSVPLKQIGKMGWDNLSKGLIGLAGAMTILAVGLNALKYTTEGSGALLLAAGALLILTPAMKAMGGMSWGDIAKALIAMAGAFAVIGAAGVLLGPAAPAIAAFSASLVIFGIACTTIGVGIVALSAGISALNGSIVGIGATIVLVLDEIVNGFFGLVQSVASGIANSVTAIGEAFAAIIIAACSAISQTLPQLVDTILTVLISVLSSLKTYAPQLVEALADALVVIFGSLSVKIPELVTAAVGFIGEFIRALIVAIGGENLDKLLKSLLAVSGIFVALGITAKVVSTIPIAGAVKGIAAFAIFVAGVGAILAALGGLSKINGFSDLISSGGGILGQIGTGLGIFVGNIIGGLSGGIAEGLPLIGQGLSDFIVALEPFIVGLNDIDSAILRNAANLAGAVLAITAAEIIAGITSFITGDSSIEKFGEEIAIFGNYLKTFSDNVTGINPENVTAAANAAKALAQMADKIPNEGGVAAWFAGENSVASFGDELVSFGENLKGFSDKVQGIVPENIEAAASAGIALAKMADTIPNEGGVVGWFAGENSPAKFGNEIASFGENLNAFSNNVCDVDPERVVAAAAAAKALAEMAKIIPNEGGVAAWFAGENSVAKFGNELVSFGSDLKGFDNSVEGIVPENVTAAANAAKALAEMAKIIPNEGGMAAWFAGDNSVAAFGKEISSFGPNLKAFSTGVEGIVPENIVAAADAAKALAEMTRVIPDSGGVVQWFTGEKSIAKFGVEIADLGSNLKLFSERVSGIESDDAYVAAEVGKAIAEMTRTIPNEGGVVQWFTGEKSIAKFGTEVVDLGENLKSFSEKVSGIQSDDAYIAAEVGKAIAEMTRTIPSEGGVVQWFTGEKSISKFGNEVVSLGENLKSFSEKVSGINSEDAYIAADVGKALAEMTQHIPNEGGVVQWFTGEKSIAKFGGQIASFGEDLMTYADNVSGIKSGSANDATAVARALAEMAQVIPNTGGVISWFAGDNNVDDFGRRLSSFGLSLKAYSDYVTGIDTTAIDHSTGVAQTLAGLSQVLVGMVFDNTGTATGLSYLGGMIVSFSESYVKFYENIMNTEPDVVSDIISQMWNFVGQSNWAGNGKGSALSEFLQSLGKVIEEIDGFDDKISANKSTVANAMTSLLTNLSSVIEGYRPKFVKVGDYIVDGLIQGMKQGNGRVAEAGNTLAITALNATRNGLDIHSPSKEYSRLGEYADEGFAEGIRQGVSSVSSAGYSIARAAIEASREGLDSHSPSKEYIYLGENIGEGFAIGINNSIVPVEEAASEMTDTVIAVSQQGLDSWDDWLSERKYYNEISLMDELTGWQTLQAMYEEGSEERKKIDREVYRVENEIVSSTYENAVSWIEKEKFYNRLSKEEELALYEGMQSRYMEGSKEREEIDRQIYTLQNAIVSDSYQSTVDWIEKEKFYNRLSKEEELALYEGMQSKYMEGSKEREEIDRQIYTLQNAIVSDSYQSTIDWIEEELYYGRMSTKEKLEMLRQLQEQYQDNAEIQKELAREVFDTEKQYNQERMQISYNWIDDEKYYGRLSKADELAAWTRVRNKSYASDSDRKKADKEIYRIQKEMYEAEKQYLSDVQDLYEQANDKRMQLEEEYADKVRSINDRLESDIKSLNDQYLDALDSRTQSLYDSYKLFDAVTKKEEVSSVTLMNNLEDQVKEFADWRDILSQLSGRGLSGEMISELQQMGPSAIAEIKAINSMSDDELEKYVSLWGIKHSMARAQAVDELEGLRIETQNSIDQLCLDAQEELEEYKAVWQSKMDDVNRETEEQLAKLQEEFAKSMGLIKEDTTEQMKEMSETALKILKEAGWSETGKQIVAGMTLGVRDETPSFIDELTEMALAGIEAVKDTLDIHSPSGVFETLGGYVGIGFVEGLRNYTDSTYEAGTAMAVSVRNGLSDAITSISEYVENGIDAQPTIRPVIDLSDVQNGATTISSLLSSGKLSMLNDLNSLSIDGNSIRHQTNITIDNDGILDEIKELRADMSAIADRITRMQIVMDTGTLVGELSEPMDSALGRRAVYKGRGI